MKLTIGADPEFFVMKDGVHISAHGLVKGDKRNPFPVNKGAVQVDGMALEFNIDPVEDELSFNDNLDTVLSELMNMIPNDVTVSSDSIAEFTLEYMSTQPRSAIRLGCDEDFNAWSRSVNPSPDISKYPNIRTAAGHIHIGYERKNNNDFISIMEDCFKVVKQLDYVIGIPSIILDRKGTERRKLYGKAGSFRPKPYGLEYRVLSNFWINDPKLRSWIFKSIHNAFDWLEEGRVFEDKFKNNAQLVIDEDDLFLAEGFCKYENIELPL